MGHGEIINYGKYYYSFEQDIFICHKCGFKTPSEDEMVKHVNNKEIHAKDGG